MQPARMPATPYLHAALRALAGNLFLESGVRGGDSDAEPPAVELSCLLVCKYPKKVARIYPQANACPACFVLIFSIRPFFLRLFVVVKGVPFLNVFNLLCRDGLRISTAYEMAEKTV